MQPERPKGSARGISAPPARSRPGSKRESIPAWAVTYGDLMSLLLVFFVLLASYSRVDVSKYRSLVGSFQDAFGRRDRVLQAPMIADTPVEGMDAAAQEQQRQKVEQEVEALIDEVGGPVEVEKTDEGTRVRVDGTALFDSGNADLRETGRVFLARLAPLLREYPHLIQVEGHTDDVPIQNEVYPSNWELSAARAGSVVREFVEHRIASSSLVAVGFAETRPLASNGSPEGRQRNRRIELLLTIPRSGPGPGELLEAPIQALR